MRIHPSTTRWTASGDFWNRKRGLSRWMLCKPDDGTSELTNAQGSPTAEGLLQASDGTRIHCLRGGSGLSAVQVKPRVGAAGIEARGQLGKPCPRHQTVAVSHQITFFSGGSYKVDRLAYGMSWLLFFSQMSGRRFSNRCFEVKQSMHWALL